MMKTFSLAAGDVDAVDRNKRSPLHWAASQGYHEYVRLLLKQGASPALVDVEGKTPLHWAASSEAAAAAGASAANVEHRQFIVSVYP